MIEIMSSQLIISIRTKGRMLTKNVVESFQKTVIYCAIDIPEESISELLLQWERILLICLFLLRYS